jgi:circadian clock protein KaiC
MGPSNPGKNRNNDHRISSGIKEFDEILGGGFPERRMFLIEGAPGSGKTTLALEFLIEGAKNSEPGLYITFSESDDEIRSVAASHGWDLTGITLLELTALSSRLKAQEQYTVFQPAEVELSETTQRVVDEVKRLSPRRVVVDSLTEIRLVAGDALRYRRQILGLKDILSKCDCTVLMLEDHTLGDPDLLLQSIAHGVVLLEKVQLEYGGVRRKLQISKMRGGPTFEGVHDFVIGEGGLRVYPRLVAGQPPSGVARKTKFGELKTGNKDLDQVIGGGLSWGTGVVLSGSAGTGKSTVGIQILHAALEAGHKVSGFLFDEALNTYLHRAKQVSLDLTRFVDNGALAIRQMDPNEQSPGEFAYWVRKQVEEQGVRVVLVDSLNGYLASMTSERFLLAQLHELLAYLNMHDVLSVMTTGQHGLLAEDTAFALTYLADLVIYLRYFEAGGKVRKAISVIKNRMAEPEMSIREFKITSAGLSVGAPLAKFEGILSGIPRYLGDPEELLNSAAEAGDTDGSTST